jgi:hypothetical protein
MKRTLSFFAMGAFGLVLAGCTGGSNTYTPVAHGYKQIELLSRPAVKELFEKFVDHQTTNAVEPYSDPTLQGEIQSFTDALRAPTGGNDYGHALAGILYPNEMAADLSQTGAASYLAIETGGHFAPGHSTFGGRAVTDDVITISLGAVFGNTLPTLGVPGAGEDHQENNCLTTDNVAQNATQMPTATFPYLPAPH